MKGQGGNAPVMSPLSSIPALYCSDQQWQWKQNSLYLNFGVVQQHTGQQIFDLVLFILIFWCFLMLFGALSPKMTLVFS